MQSTPKIPEIIDPQGAFATNGQEAWRVLGIMAEFAMATERLRGIRPAVSMFGSARIGAGHPYYETARAIARKLSDAGFSVISGGGPGLMEAFNHGAFEGRSPESPGLGRLSLAATRGRDGWPPTTGSGLQACYRKPRRSADGGAFHSRRRPTPPDGRRAG